MHEIQTQELSGSTRLIVGLLGAEVEAEGGCISHPAIVDARLLEIEKRILRIEAFLGPLP